MLSDEIYEEKRGTKYRERDEEKASLLCGGAGGRSSDRSGYQVVERAKGGTENPETLDRFAIPEDRREITHSY